MIQKYFLFDIGHVLVDFEFEALYQAISDGSGRPVSLPDERDLEMVNAVETGHLSDQEFIDYLNDAKGLSWSLDEYIGVWAGMFSVHPVGHTLFTDAIARGIPVYTLSNIAKHHVDAIERNEPGFFDGATGLFLSYEMGVRKPHPDIYAQVLSELDADGSQCFFIDDRPENIEAARAAGIEAHQFIPENYDPIHKAIESFF